MSKHRNREAVIVRVPKGMREEFGRAAMRSGEYRSRNDAACQAFRDFIQRERAREVAEAKLLAAALAETEGVGVR